MVLVDFHAILTATYLYNWKTDQNCQLPFLPQPMYAQAPIIMNDTVAYCGGYSSTSSMYTSQCYKLDKITKTWIQVSLAFF